MQSFSSSAHEEKSQNSTREALLDFIKKQKLEEDAIDALIVGYCHNNDILKKVSKWKKENYKRCTRVSSEDDLKWLDKLVFNLGIIKNSKEYYAQSCIKKKFILFFSKYEQYKTQTMVDDLETGHCSGFSFLVANSFMLQFVIPEPDFKIDNWDWVKQVFFLLGDWDGHSEFSIQDQQDINAVFWLLYRAQFSSKLLSIAQCDWHRIYSGDKTLNLYSATVFPFSEKNFIYLIERLIIPSTRNYRASRIRECKEKYKPLPGEENDIEFLRLGINGHASVVIKITHLKTRQFKLFYYNPNCFNGPIELNDLNLLIKIVKMAHHIDETDSLVRANLFGFKVSQKVVLIDFLTEVYQEAPKKMINLAAKLSIICNSSETFNFLLNIKHFDLKIKYDENFTILHLAAQYDRLYVAKIALEMHPNLVNSRTEDGKTPLHFAAKMGSVEMIKLLLANHARITAKTDSSSIKHPGETAFDIAQRKNHIEAMDFLLQNASHRLFKPKEIKSSRKRKREENDIAGEVCFPHSEERSVRRRISGR